MVLPFGLNVTEVMMRQPSPSYWSTMNLLMTARRIISKTALTAMIGNVLAGDARSMFTKLDLMMLEKSQVGEYMSDLRFSYNLKIP